MKSQGSIIDISILNQDNFNPKYPDWLNDPGVNQFIESRFSTHTLESSKEFITAMENSEFNYLFGIFSKEGTHIGNVKIGSIDWHHKFADIGIFIGEIQEHSRGAGTEAIRLATDFAFAELKLNKLVAGVYSTNISSKRIFEKNDYTCIGTYKRHRLFENRWIDQYIFEKLNPELPGSYT